MFTIRSMAIAILTVGALAIPASGAFAGVTPTPQNTCSPTAAPAGPSYGSPTVSPQFGYNPCPPPVVRPVARDWDFDGQVSSFSGFNINNVDGRGILAFLHWQNTDLNPFVSRFALGGNSVTILRSRLPIPVINPFSCTATFFQPFGHFRLLSGTGTGANLRQVARGDFALTGTVSVDRILARHGYGNGTICPLLFVSPFAVRAAVEGNLPIAGQLPRLIDFSFQGHTRLLRVVPVVIPTPYPTGPGHFAPTTTPTATLLPA
jgi:hypothetical protein